LQQKNVTQSERFFDNDDKIDIWNFRKFRI
jgi:hypothetical protein